MLVCEFCKKEFSSKYNHVRHLSNCKLKQDVEKTQLIEANNLYKTQLIEADNLYKTQLIEATTPYKTQIIELEKENAILKARLEERLETYKESSNEKNKLIEKAISKPSIQQTQHITQNNVNITPMYTQEQYAEIAREKFTIQHFNKGAKGVSNFIGETIPEEMLSFSDMSRNVLSYKDATGKNIKDTNALNFLTKLVRPSIIEPATKIYNSIQEQIANEPPSPVNSGYESDNEVDERKSNKQLKLEKETRNMNEISKLGKKKVTRATIVDELKLVFNRKASFNDIES